MNTRKEYGDFQTPADLATQVTALVDSLFGTPELVIEPTCGVGAFIHAAVRQWGKASCYDGFEINLDYIQQAQESLNGHPATLHHSDFFAEDWNDRLNDGISRRVLVLGNPPWVTNSELSKMGSDNLPKKTNFQGLRGLDARTGKANFDIAEWIIIKLIESLPPNGALAMLCKTATARKVLKHVWKTRGGLKDSRLFRLDAKTAFDVAVDACLFATTVCPAEERTATVYSHLHLNASRQSFGFIDGDLVSDIAAYRRYRHFDGGNINYIWRSGVKHDAASIMEFNREGDFYSNGLGEKIRLEENYIYPLLKSSDIGNGRTAPRKYVLIPQLRTGDDTAQIQHLAPLTWDYLIRHEAVFNKRQSSIYRNRPPFSIFGIGDYSFAPWKVAVSGLYKTFTFVIVPPVNERPVMLDDTCYALACQNEEEARLLWELLSSAPALDFLRSLIFTDAKRPVTVDILRRLSLTTVAKHFGKTEKLRALARYSPSEGDNQTYLLMEGSP